MRGLVIRNTGSSYLVRTDDGRDQECRIKGTFRIKGIKSTNPVAVGDYVEFSPARDGEPAYITDIEERRNYIIRRSSNLSKQSHILACNLDQCLLVVTISHPVTSTVFIDRFLASAWAYRVPVVLVFNKTDLLTEEDGATLQELTSLYQEIGYSCLQCDALHGEGIDQVLQVLKGKVSLVSGNSGVGKSTLINRILPELNQRTAQISEKHDTGMHTTTFSEMIPFESGWLIDTPGIKGFGTFDMEREELTSYFKEIFEFSKQCRFSDCTHTHEPGCAVLQAVEEHYIAQSRYQSYLSMLEDKDENKYREAY